MKMIIIVIVVSILINYLITLKSKKKYKQQINFNTFIKENNQYNNNFYRYYKRKRYLTTKNEIELYRILVEIANKYNLLVLSQVVLYEIIEVNLNKYDKDYLKYFNKIQSKSIDFVIVDKNTTRILQCIELDDSTHNNQKRIERDTFINELFGALEIPLLRIKVQKEYDKQYIENIVSQTCTDKLYSRE